MTQSYTPYLDFLRFSLNEEAQVPESVKLIDWDQLLQFAKDQCVPGIYWMGVRRLGHLKENKPTDDHVMRWMAACGKLGKRNSTVTERSAWVAKNFEKEGFRACLLKGQGLALCYPDPSLRYPGDIDIWVRPDRQSRSSNATASRSNGSSSASQRSSGSNSSSATASHSSHSSFHFSLFTHREDADIRTVSAYCRQFVPDAKACYHHIDFLKAGDIPVEVHYRPSWLNNPFHNRRLQRYFLDHADAQFSNLQPQGFATPTWEFNVVFLLSHIANHLLHEGIGLKQVIDYYYLLRSQTERRNIDSYEQEFRCLGLLPFARQLMWVLCQVLGLDEQLLVARQDERRGRLLLSEMLAGGNFGMHDDRPLSGFYTSGLKSNLQRVVRDLRMMRYFPSESLWEPAFRIWHYFWRRRHRS
ncbi:MAG: nucleotidyltransferase family protein [Prevotella sp.]|nr:nucleotidyltransferase family protein [Prevotella sp.]